MPLPVLYSFRRCPYAIRARLALRYAGVQVELREVLLRDKPQAMLEASAKGTVPVLVLADSKVIDESMDIMHWALEQSDPDGWLNGNSDDNSASELIRANDNDFKYWLDKYKYAVRFPEHSESHYREQCRTFLQRLEALLAGQPYLHGKSIGLADAAIFPFVRQFDGVEPGWLEQHYPQLCDWLEHWKASGMFLSVMQKYPRWQPDTEETIVF